MLHQTGLSAQADSENDLGGCSDLLAEFLTTVSHPSSLVERSLRRQTPKVGARCVNHARRDLCGGAQ